MNFAFGVVATEEQKTAPARAPGATRRSRSSVAGATRRRSSKVMCESATVGATPVSAWQLESTSIATSSDSETDRESAASTSPSMSIASTAATSGSRGLAALSRLPAALRERANRLSALGSSMRPKSSGPKRPPTLDALKRMTDDAVLNEFFAGLK